MLDGWADRNIEINEERSVTNSNNNRGEGEGNIKLETIQRQEE